MIKNKAMLNIGFIYRTCGTFLDLILLKILYSSFVHFNSEYHLLIRSNNTLKQNNALESVQNNLYNNLHNNFWQFIPFKFNTHRPRSPYDGILNCFNLIPLLLFVVAVYFCSQEMFAQIVLLR